MLIEEKFNAFVVKWLISYVESYSKRFKDQAWLVA
jgi:hypothetical protein